MKSQRNKIFSILLLLPLMTFCNLLVAQQQKFAIGFYNLENLFDTLDDSLSLDEEFTPQGSKAWHMEVYKDKIQRLSKVIHGMQTLQNTAPLTILGVCEIENKKVLEDLCNSELLEYQYYKIVHFNSPDIRGVDVGLLYQSKYFTVLYSESLTVPLVEKDGSDRFTRDILLVKGKLGNQLVYVFVNHWPSRRGGEESKSFRMIAAKVIRKYTDSIMNLTPNASVIIMGDFNDNPNDESITQGLLSTSDPDKMSGKMFFNPFYKNYKKGEGTTSFNDAWNVFDQILLSNNFISKSPLPGLKYSSHTIFKKSFMFEKQEHFKNNPKRSFSGDRYNYGYSDHFPVICYITLE